MLVHTSDFDALDNTGVQCFYGPRYKIGFGYICAHNSWYCQWFCKTCSSLFLNLSFYIKKKSVNMKQNSRSVYKISFVLKNKVITK